MTWLTEARGLCFGSTSGGACAWAPGGRTADEAASVAHARTSERTCRIGAHGKGMLSLRTAATTVSRRAGAGYDVNFLRPSHARGGALIARRRASPMNIATTLEGDTAAQVRLAGRLDGEAAAQLADTLERLLRDGRRAVVLEMSGVTYLSSPGTLALQQAQQEWASLRGELRVVAPSREAREALASAELLPRLMEPVAPDGQAAFPPTPFE